LIPKLWTIFSMSIEAQHVKSTNYKNVYNLKSKFSQIITNTRWVQLVHKHFTICIHKSLNPNISQHLQCLLKSQNTSPLILEIFFILHQTHTTKKTYNQWVSSRMVQTYINSTSRGTCCNSTNPKYNVVTWCKNTITWRFKKKLTCISIRKWVGFSSKTFGVFNFQVTFLLLGLYLNIWNQPCTIVVAFISNNN